MGLLVPARMRCLSRSPSVATVTIVPLALRVAGWPVSDGEPAGRAAQARRADRTCHARHGRLLPLGHDRACCRVGRAGDSRVRSRGGHRLRPSHAAERDHDRPPPTTRRRGRPPRRGRVHAPRVLAWTAATGGSRRDCERRLVPAVLPDRARARLRQAARALRRPLHRIPLIAASGVIGSGVAERRTRSCARTAGRPVARRQPPMHRDPRARRRSGRRRLCDPGLRAAWASSCSYTLRAEPCRARVCPDARSDRTSHLRAAIP